MNINVNINLLRDCAQVPTYGSDAAAGADLYAGIEKGICIWPGDTEPVPTGIAMEIPDGFAGLIFARSGLSCKHGLAPANKVGIIDSDYRGEIIVYLHNHGKQKVWVNPGDRIAQFILMPTYIADFNKVAALNETNRGTGGFGSTGK